MAIKKTAKKKAVKKAAVKPTAVKTAVKKAPAAKKAVKKTVVKKTVSKKTAVKKPATEAPAKTATASTPPLTTVVADLDVGWGNAIYLRGEGGPLAWNKGIQMDCADGKWTWATTDAADGLVFKFLLNDKTWAKGENTTVAAGSTAVLRPVF
ncbi:hypothetical protein [Cerasicoccus arenae]|uniref:Uncharacterized protein n=1 Tax=Cerasicoccus arenae TaxID=424488 RepID=A0A8J3DAI1_9BACT|nr:hypothetical protein [Cerasicoccus arenae]MBK1858003.1 hypothetical protein [Cerasicoccus arenae]GHB97529.1 hypothetical protein GCM10007047_11700 [Cerasicoccus arenae]